MAFQVLGSGCYGKPRNVHTLLTEDPRILQMINIIRGFDNNFQCVLPLNTTITETDLPFKTFGVGTNIIKLHNICIV